MNKAPKRHTDRFRGYVKRIVTHELSEEIYFGVGDEHKEMLKHFNNRYMIAAQGWIDEVLTPLTMEVNKMITMDELMKFTPEMFPVPVREKMLDFICDFGDEYKLNDVQLTFLITVAMEVYLGNIQAGLQGITNARRISIRKAPGLVDSAGRPL